MEGYEPVNIRIVYAIPKCFLSSEVQNALLVIYKLLASEYPARYSHNMGHDQYLLLMELHVHTIHNTTVASFTGVIRIFEQPDISLYGLTL